MNSRYQLIKPILSDRIHESSSMLKGAKKCYKELKTFNAHNSETFTIRDIDTNKSFVFKIHHTHIPETTNNNKLETLIQSTPLTQIQESVKKIEENIKNIEIKVETLENTIINSINITDKYNQNNCVIM